MSRNKNDKFPDVAESYWLDSAELRKFPKVTEDVVADAVVIGAGISGVMTAYLLTQQGYKVVVVEAGKVLNGTTGYTTAKLTAQHGLIYDYLIEHLGQEKTRLYYEANAKALEYVKEVVVQKEIDCDFSEETAFIYAEDKEQQKKVQKEAQAYEKLGIDGGFTDDIPLNILNFGAVMMKSQAQFHPVKFLIPLIEEIVAAGGAFFEHTMIQDIEKGETSAAITADGLKVSGKYIAVCSHFPFYDKEGFYFARLHPKRSYTLAVETAMKFPGGMYLSAGDPKYSLRTVYEGGKKLILIGGNGHSVGHKDDTKENYEQLYQFGQKTFGVEKVHYRWSAQDPSPLDKVPYIGSYGLGDENIFVATGYRKWGMTTGILAGQLLTDLITGKQSDYEEVFTPERLNKTTVKKGFKQNKHVAKMLVKDKIENPSSHLTDLQEDEGKVIEFNDQRAGAYRDRQGALHIVDTTCTHMGCETRWNNAERTWDCPCHGSRFSYEGNVVEGPATKPLKKLEE